MNRWQKILVIAVISAFAVFVIHTFTTSPISESNPLCDLAAERFKMECVLLGSPGIYDKGAFIRSSETDASLTPLPLPEDQILAESCLLNPVENVGLATFKEDPNKSIVFGKYSFNINRNVKLGANLNLPEAAGFQIKAGPEIAQAKTINLEADSAVFFNIDSSVFKSILNNCSLKRSCVSNVKDSNKRVIKQLLIAKNLRYVVTTKSGESFPLSVALEKNILDFGTKAGRDIVTTRDLSTGIDIVFAANFFDPQEFKEVKICERRIIAQDFSGRTVVSAMAGSNAPDEKQSQNDEEVVAKSTYDISDRTDSESYQPSQPSEAMAWGKWSFNEQSNTVELLSRVLAIPGLRWDFNRPEFKTTYAEAQASVKNNFEIVMTSRSEETQILIAELTSNIFETLSTNAPYDQYLSVFEIEDTRGKRNIPVLWTKNDALKRFNLGQIEPGEKVTVKLEREFKFSANRDKEGGGLWEDLEIRFFFE